MTQQRKENSIDIHRVTAYSGTTCVFKDFSLTIEAGYSTAILGRIVGDGSKTDILSSSTLSSLFDYPLQVVTVGGYYQVLPG
jgi:ABC-type enterochelin transport system ATPase subunit